LIMVSCELVQRLKYRAGFFVLGKLKIVDESV